MFDGERIILHAYMYICICLYLVNFDVAFSGVRKQSGELVVDRSRPIDLEQSSRDDVELFYVTLESGCADSREKGVEPLKSSCLSGALLAVEYPGSGFDDLLQKLPDLVRASRSVATVCKYKGYFIRWESFMRDKQQCALPAKGIHVALFIVSLINDGMASGSILAFVYAIKWFHKLNGFPDPTLHHHVLNLMETSKRVCVRRINKKDPVDPEVIKSLFKDNVENSDPIVIRDLCMIVVSFACFLRFNELSNLKCSDVIFHEDHFSLNISRSKTDQYRQGNIVVCSKLDTVACPYKALKKYVDQNRIDLCGSEYLFKPMFRSKGICRLIFKNKKMSYTRTKEALLGRLRQVPGYQGNFGLHSFRAGGATSAANGDVLDRCWKRHGRWKSDSAKDGYVLDSIVNRLEVSKNLGL